MTKYWTPPIFTQKKNYQKDLEWPKMDFKHNFKKCNIFFFNEGFPKTLQNNSEKYSKIKIPIMGKNFDALRAYGLDIKEKDYYSSPKIYCIIFRYPQYQASFTSTHTYMSSSD